MFERAKKTVKKYNLINKNEQIIVGVSGGADSVFLLLFLNSIAKKYNIKLLVIHINHGLRGLEADNDEKYVKELCEKLNIPFFAYHISLYDEAKNRKMTEEEAGRAVRYEIFKNAIKEFNADKIAVAHNMNDNAETILMNLCRGTGINGLSGINPIRDNIIRPLIETSREEIEKMLNELEVEYKTDSTNASMKYTRNRVRLELIPWLKENMNSSIIKVLSKNASVISEENNYLEEEAKKAYDECLIKDNYVRLDCEKLKELNPVILRRVLRIGCRSYNEELHDISYDHIEKLIDLLDKQTGKIIHLPNNISAHKTSDSIMILSEYEKHKGYCYKLEEEQVLYIEETGQYVSLSKNKINLLKNCINSYTISLDYDKIKNRLFIRTRKIGDKIHLKGINKYKRIKTLLIDLKIPSAKRDLMPILADENEVISVLKIKNSDLFLADDKSENIIYLQLWEEN